MLYWLITQSLLFWRIAGSWCLGFARFNLSIAIAKQTIVRMSLLGWVSTRTLILFLLIVCLWTLCMFFEEDLNGMYLNRLCPEPGVVSQFLFNEPSFNPKKKNLIFSKSYYHTHVLFVLTNSPNFISIEYNLPPNHNSCFLYNFKIPPKKKTLEI